MSNQVKMEETEVELKNRELIQRVNYFAEIILELSSQIQKKRSLACQYDFKHTDLALQNTINALLMCRNSLIQDMEDKKKELEKPEIKAG